jgi:membrane protein YdbS with pleckstrin-like domain
VTDAATFTNDAIDPHALPSVADRDFEAVSPSYKTIGYLFSAVFTAVTSTVLTILIVFVEEGTIVPFFPYFYGVIAVLAAIFVIHAQADYRHKGYAIRDKDILFRSGIIWRTVIAVPFNRLQHAELHRGPVERYFKLSSLRLFTAGGMRADMTIPALPDDKAVEIREFILERAGAKS